MSMKTKDPVTLIDKLIDKHSLTRVLEIIQDHVAEQEERTFSHLDQKACAMMKVKLHQAMLIADERCL